MGCGGKFTKVLADSICKGTDRFSINPTASASKLCLQEIETVPIRFNRPCFDKLPGFFHCVQETLSSRSSPVESKQGDIGIGVLHVLQSICHESIRHLVHIVEDQQLFFAKE